MPPKEAVRYTTVPKINQKFVDGAGDPGTYRDDTLAGFCLKVTPGKGWKVYLIDKKPKGWREAVTYTIGRDGDPLEGNRKLTAAKARELAVEVIATYYNKGINPNEAEKDRRRTLQNASAERALKEKLESLTLEAAFEEYKQIRQIKSVSARQYGYVLRTNAHDWLDIPLLNISRDAVLQRFLEIKQDRPGAANNLLRLIGFIWEFAARRYRTPDGKRIFVENPIDVISENKGWNKLEPRSNLISDLQLGKWYQSVLAVQNVTVRNLFLMEIYTGLRANECATLKWSGVDLTLGTIEAQTKRSKTLVLPITTQLRAILLEQESEIERIRTSGLKGSTGKYVFPGDSQDGHVGAAWHTIKQIQQASGVKFSHHVLRRTLATLAGRLEMPDHQINAILNHGPATTAQRHYIVRQAESLREPLQRLNDELDKLMGAKNKNEISTESRTGKKRRDRSITKVSSR
jgi:integrase